jgi:hypothetical protein
MPNSPSQQFPLVWREAKFKAFATGVDNIRTPDERLQWHRTAIKEVLFDYLAIRPKVEPVDPAMVRNSVTPDGRGDKPYQ